MDAARTTKQLEETIDEFEKQKIQDIKVCCDELFCAPQIKNHSHGEYRVCPLRQWVVVKPDNDYSHISILLQLSETHACAVISKLVMSCGQQAVVVLSNDV